MGYDVGTIKSDTTCINIYVYTAVRLNTVSGVDEKQEQPSGVGGDLLINVLSFTILHIFIEYQHID